MSTLKRRNPFEDLHESKFQCNVLVPNHNSYKDVIMISNKFEKKLEKILEIKFLHYLDNLFGDESDSDTD
jgi:hypothetical protein